MRISSLRPAYLTRRLRQQAFQRRHPDAPWLTEASILLLDTWLRPTDAGLEWGSGRSTTWFATRVARLISIEENRFWFESVSEQLARRAMTARVDYRCIPCEHAEQDEPASHPYADVALAIQDESLDFALVDGNIRALCMLRVMPKLRKGGLLILDNANRYVPNRHMGGHSTIHEARDLPRTRLWEEILTALRDWRSINTSDGIWDTRVWMRP